ncbi:hypothetical protein A5707_05685 [Mycobacterium kyorinense]|uniref:Uncharacterized protein n=1 Tax=Mycobacterium kyorinense TaxID=487514 RepID=A0A1A2Z0A9_9MYCO|nr:hypothetical protein [Mycobacterium kyorinense]OBI42937.1 hypothetical protein A5707_05685 [Mycobacterium kyorinense]
MNIVGGNSAVASPAATTKKHLRAAPTPVLISEHEVVFGTAAAVPVRPNTVHWWSEAAGIVRAGMHRLSLSATPNDRQPRRPYPKRYGFLERSCMGREMQRL